MSSYFQKTPKEHIQRLRRVFQKLWEAGLKLKPSKCEFFRTRISYLGHVVSKDGVETDPKKIEAIKNWPTPESVTDVRSFLGFTNHYHRFIKRYEQIARPLYKLISGKNAQLKKKTVKWNSDHEYAFQKNFVVILQFYLMIITIKDSYYTLMLVNWI